MFWHEIENTIIAYSGLYSSFYDLISCLCGINEKIKSSTCPYTVKSPRGGWLHIFNELYKLVTLNIAAEARSQCTPQKLMVNGIGKRNVASTAFPFQFGLELWRVIQQQYALRVV
jgi:hypothetical protein